MEFFRITRSYRNEVLKQSENATITSSYSNAATLYEKTQDQAKNLMNNKSSDEKFRERKCICDEMHLFRKCSYIVISARKPGWKESLTIKNEARPRIFKNARFQIVIKVITNIDILNELSEDDETAQKEDTETVKLNRTFKFGNVTIRATNIKNSLSKMCNL